jgi:uncharacterized tellurite resistance protein B-like protein
MLTTAIQNFLARRKRGDDSPEPSFAPEDLAVAALMVECARIDGDHSEVELGTIVAFVRDRCGLDHETAECLVAVAERKHDDVWHDFLFTSAVKDAYDEEGRRQLIEHLWGIAAADGEIHDFEEKLVQRIARELEVPDEAVSESRAQVLEGLGLGGAEA